MAFKPEQNSFATYKKVNNLKDGSGTRMREEMHALRGASGMQPDHSFVVIPSLFKPHKQFKFILRKSIGQRLRQPHSNGI